MKVSRLGPVNCDGVSTNVGLLVASCEINVNGSVREPSRGTNGAGTAPGQRGLIGSRLYDSTSDENFAYFRKPRLALVVLVALDNGDPVIALLDRKLGSRGECSVERRCDIIGPKDPYSVFGLAQGAD